MALHALSKHPKTRFQGGTRDLRNWEIRDRRSDQRLGTVDDVLVDENGYTTPAPCGCATWRWPPRRATRTGARC